MTSARFADLAANALAAAEFIGQDNPALSRRFADAAVSARRLSRDLAQQEFLVLTGAELTEAS